MADLPAGFRGTCAFELKRALRDLRRYGVPARGAPELASFLPLLPRVLRAGDVVLLSVFHTDHAFPASVAAAIRSDPG
jgi:hypothetical protein